MINRERIYTVGLKYMYRIPAKKDNGKRSSQVFGNFVSHEIQDSARVARNAFWVNVDL